MLSTGHYLAGAAELAVLASAATFGGARLRSRLLPGWSGAPAWLATAVLAVALLIGVAEVLGSAGLFEDLALLAGALVQGARGQTQSFPFACYPTFQYDPGATMPDLRFSATLDDGRTVDVPPGKRTQRQWGTIFALAQTYNCSNCSAGLVMHSIAPDGTTTFEHLWSVSNDTELGFTVGKVFGGAVVRNRMKRRLREAVRLEGFRLIAVDVVINPKKSLLDAEFPEVRKEVGRAFQVIEQKLSEKRNT